MKSDTTSSDIEDAGIQRPEDFIALTPNVVMANTVNVGDTLVTIRINIHQRR